MNTKFYTFSFLPLV